MLTQNLLTQFFFQTQHFSNFNPKDILVHKFLDKRIFQPKNFWTKTFLNQIFLDPMSDKTWEIKLKQGLCLKVLVLGRVKFW